MTVAPNQAQDGDHSLNAGDKGVQMDKNSRPEALPPTLFKLPSLNAEQQSDTSSESDDHQTPAPPAVSVEIETPVGGARPIVTDSFQEAVAQPEPVTARSEPAATEPESAVSAPRTYSSNEIPAARTWMENVKSHGVVVVLLLIVVVAALVTSSNGSKESDDALAESSDLLNIDVGSEITLPIPAHDHNDSTVARLGEDSTATTDVEPQSVTASSTSVSSTTVALAPPEANTINTPPEVSPTPTLDDNAAVEAVAVSRRVPTATDLDGFPSLEDLAEPADLDTTRNAAEAVDTPVNQAIQRPTTNTPVGLDLLRFLPQDSQ